MARMLLSSGYAQNLLLHSQRFHHPWRSTENGSCIPSVSTIPGGHACRCRGEQLMRNVFEEGL